MQRVRRCNRCGRKLTVYDEELGFAVHTKMGYGSDYDGEIVELVLCCDCADDIIAECIVSPLEGGGPIQF